LTSRRFPGSVRERAEEHVTAFYGGKGKENYMKRALSLSASVLMLICCNAANAQTASTSSSAGVETVVVTAERRSENLMKTPIAADVISGSELQAKGVVSVDQLQFLAPSVTVDNFGQGIDFNIRGIGKGEHNSQTATGVITYRDGVATFPGYIAEEPYYDISGIQILRGPQGTFVGQNATGGAVFVDSANPVIGGGYDGYVMSSFGNYDAGMVQGGVNIPVSDTFALRISGFGSARGSFYSIADTDPADNCPHDKYANCKPGYNPGDERWGAGRVSALWKPTEALSVLLKVDGDYLDNGAYPGDSFEDGFKTYQGLNTPNPHYSDLFHITANAPQGGMDRFMRTSLKIDYVLPDGITLRSISGYQTASTDYRADLDGTSFAETNPPIFVNVGTAAAPVAFQVYGADDSTFFDKVGETIFSQEFNVISPDTGLFTWVAGVYTQSNTYDFEKPYQFVVGVPAGSLATQYALQGNNPNQAWAAFGQGSLNLSNGLQLQLGGRWSDSRSKNDVQILQYGLFIQDYRSTESSSFDYKASANWTINDDQFVYAFVATGYKPGGLNVPVSTVPPFNNPAPFGPERVMEYETGWKATWFDGHVRTQIDGYYNDYKNFQVTIGDPLVPVFGFEVNDPHTTKIYGLEAETQASFGALSFSGGVGLMHSSLGGFYATDPRVLSVEACDPATGPAGPSCINLKGNQQTYAPNFTFNLSAQYVFDIGAGDKLTPRVNFAHESQQWATLFENPNLGDRLGSRDILGAQLDWTHGTYDLTLYGTNLTDQHYVAALQSNIRFAGAPRQYGISLTKAF
jgi:iron complex outermembrane recepter protein